MKRRLEIEFKYHAKDIKLGDFKEFCCRLDPVEFFTAFGYDKFYSNKKDPESFFRHRVSNTFNQLTFKKKTKSDNSFIRIEHNLNLRSKVTAEEIRDYCHDFGYDYNFMLNKQSFIYTYDWYILSYYICFNEEMEEVGRFIELEIKEDIEWESEGAAWNELIVLEKVCSKLGIKPKNRCTESLFEMFRRD